jgi:predicted ATPase
MPRIGDEPYLESAYLDRAKVDSFARYPFHLPAVRGLDQIAFHPEVTFLVGENGSGKSTLLEALAVASGLSGEGGSQNFGPRTRDTHSDLHEAIRLVRGIRQPSDTFFLRAESFYNVASQLDDMEEERPGLLRNYGGKSLHEQSHGESFLALAMHRLHGLGLYLLDEPEAALSPSRQMAFLAVLHDLVMRKSQFVIATHSPILMAYPRAWIYSLDDGVKRVEYRETEHYRITRRFLEAPERMLAELMAD